jgi:hypothetical protein
MLYEKGKNSGVKWFIRQLLDNATKQSSDGPVAVLAEPVRTPPPHSMDYTLFTEGNGFDARDVLTRELVEHSGSK